MLFGKKLKAPALSFKYYPDPLGQGDFKNDQRVKCDCCGKKTDIYYDGPFYAEEDVEYLCPQCIASGKAAEKLEGEFVDIGCCDSVDDPEAQEELACRTPSYHGWQQEQWLTCCGDYCAFIAYVGWKELEEMGLAEEICQTYNEDECMIDLETVKENLFNGGSLQGYLFRCLHCGKHHLYVDAD